MKSITRRCEMRPRTMVVIGIGAVAALAAIVLLVGWLGLGWFKAPATPAMTEPTPEVRVVEQTRIVFVEQTTTPGAPTAPPSAPPTAIPPATATPANTAVAPSGSMPAGWEEVEITEPQCTGGRRLIFNHDNDGQFEFVFFTWGQVQLVNEQGEVKEDLGTVVRLTQDPDGERLAVTGGWRKFQFEGQPGQSDIDAITKWVHTALASNASFACNAQNDYAVSVQEIIHAPSEAVAGSEPTGWTEVALNPAGDSFVPAGDVLVQEKDWDHKGNHWVTIAWFWANFTKPSGSNACTAIVVTNTGESSFWFQGAHRTWEYAGGNPSKDDVQSLVKWWITKGLETEPNGAGCAKPGAYTVLWQDPAIAPTSPNGRP